MRDYLPPQQPSPYPQASPQPSPTNIPNTDPTSLNGHHQAPPTTLPTPSRHTLLTNLTSNLASSISSNNHHHAGSSQRGGGTGGGGLGRSGLVGFGTPSTPSSSSSTSSFSTSSKLTGYPSPSPTPKITGYPSPSPSPSPSPKITGYPPPAGYPPPSTPTPTTSRTLYTATNPTAPAPLPTTDGGGYTVGGVVNSNGAAGGVVNSSRGLSTVSDSGIGANVGGSRSGAGLVSLSHPSSSPSSSSSSSGRRSSLPSSSSFLSSGGSYSSSYPSSSYPSPSSSSYSSSPSYPSSSSYSSSSYPSSPSSPYPSSSSPSYPPASSSYSSSSSYPSTSSSASSSPSPSSSSSLSSVKATFASKGLNIEPGQAQQLKNQILAYQTLCQNKSLDELTLASIQGQGTHSSSSSSFSQTSLATTSSPLIQSLPPKSGSSSTAYPSSSVPMPSSSSSTSHLPSPSPSSYLSSPISLPSISTTTKPPTISPSYRIQDRPPPLPPNKSGYHTSNFTSASPSWQPQQQPRPQYPQPQYQTPQRYASHPHLPVTAPPARVLITQIPPQLPQEIPPEKMVDFYEARFQFLLQRRAEELQDLAHAGDLRADIEGRGLSLVDLQRSLRAKVGVQMKKIALAESRDAGNVRRSRRASKRVEVVKVRKVSEEEARKVSQAKFIEAVLQHRKLFMEFHSQKNQQSKKVHRQVQQFHSNKEKQEQKRKEREAKERLRLLKVGNEDAYRKHVEETKNKRLAKLLEQTDDCLLRLGALVVKQKDNKEGEEEGEEEEEEEEEKEEKEEEEKKVDKREEAKTYYQLAHSIEEEVKKQPEMLEGGKLKPYQLIGVQWLVSLYNNNLNGILADEMGLGKTIQTIGLVCYLMEVKQLYGPYLIIVPLSTLINWSMEFSKWAPSVHKVVYKGDPATRKAIFRDDIASGKFNVLLTTYEFVLKDKNSLSKVKWAYIIIDEGHRMKNRHCKLSTTLARDYESRNRLLLTGTPLQNSLPELWSLLNFLLPHMFSSQSSFEQWFNAPFDIKEDVVVTEEETLLIINRLHKVLRPFLFRRVKSQVEGQLPEKIERVLRCEFSAYQKKIYDSLRLRNAPSELTKKGLSLQNTMMQLRKSCNHPYLFQDEYLIDDNIVRSAGKFALLDHLLPKLQRAGHRVLIFSQMVELLAILGDFLALRGFTFLRLDGQTKSDDRGDLVNTFNAPNSPYFVFMLSTRAGGLGLNLQSADTVIIFDSDWNPQADLQAQDRAHRIGQKNEVRVYRLVTMNSIEEQILERATYKLDMDKKIIQAGMFNNVSTDTDRKSFLTRLFNSSEGDGESEKVPSLKQINELAARDEEELKLFTEIDKQRALEKKKAWEGSGRRGNPPPMLMTEKEVPSYFLPKEGEKEKEGGGGEEEGSVRAAARSVKYSEELSEIEWTKMLESGLGKDEWVMQRDEKRRKRKEGKGKRGRRGGRMVEEESEESEEESDQEEEMGEARDAQGAYYRIYKAVMGAKDVDGRVRSDLFMKKPSRREYPHYYTIIQRPICLTMIKGKIDRKVYLKKHHSFKEDFDLLFSNAQIFNQSGSIVYEDSVKMQEIFTGLYDRYTEEGTFETKPPATPKGRPRGSSRGAGGGRGRGRGRGVKATPKRKVVEEDDEEFDEFDEDDDRGEVVVEVEKLVKEIAREKARGKGKDKEEKKRKRANSMPQLPSAARTPNQPPRKRSRATPSRSRK